ncbi:MAG: hypothetical protein IJY75_05480 [Bacteroidaceae bacterium]|nr:hypothetical protein [Bacteroidaceae bacterium]
MKKNIFMKIRTFLSKLVRNYLINKRYKTNRMFFINYFKHIISSNPDIAKNDINSKKVNVWMNKWGVFGHNPLKYGWKAFHSYVDDNVNLVPNDIARNFIEPILTPEEYQPFYNDKNSFGMFLDKEWMPKTYFRSMKGMLYNGDYEAVQREDFASLFDGIDELVVKPAKDMGGKGVTLFVRNENGVFVDDKNNELTLSYLGNTYKTEYLIQECMKQSEFMAQFNPSSVNTLRVAVYRDVKTGKLDILGAVIRIGGKGSFVDNACSGGSFISIDKNGKLGRYACNTMGHKQSTYNYIDFENNEFIIPDFDKIKTFVYNVAQRMPHMNLFANDVAIDKNGNPKLIEVNTTMFSYWLYQFNGQPAFREYTDDLIEYCLKENKKIRPHLILKYN